jgi:hypothetical protein
LESLTTALRHLADTGLGVASIITNFHHRRIVPLMERELCVFEMSDTANPTSLARSRLLHERFSKDYAATRARCGINLRAVPHSDDDLWSFVMLLDAAPVSTIFSSLIGSCFAFLTRRHGLCLQLVTVHAARSDQLTPRAQAAGRAVQQRERERAALTKEKKIWRKERLDRYNEEYRLREQQGLSPLTVLANSLSDEEEESDGEQITSDRWEPVPPSPRAEGMPVELAPEAGTEPPATGLSVEVPVGTVEVPAGAVGAPPSPRGRGNGASPV